MTLATNLVGRRCAVLSADGPPAEGEIVGLAGSETPSGFVVLVALPGSGRVEVADLAGIRLLSGDRPDILAAPLHDYRDRLSVRARNCLEMAGIPTLGDLAACTEARLLGLRHFGPRTLREVVALLAAHGLRLRASAGPPP